MGKLSAADMKEDEKVTTQKFLAHKEAILKNRDFEGEVHESIKSIMEIA